MSDISSLGLNSIQMPSTKVPAVEHSKSYKDLEKAAKDFESVFMDIVLKSMRDSVQTSEAFGNPETPKFFQTMLDEQYSKNIGQSKDGLGIAKAIMNQLGPRVFTEMAMAPKPAKKDLDLKGL